MKAIQKAIKSTVISVCVLALAACGSNGGILAPKAPDLNKLFTFTAKITEGEQSYTADLSRTDIGTWKIVFSEPYQLQGVGFVYSGDKVSASYDGLSADSLTDEFSDSPVAVIVRALETAVQNQSTGVKYNEEGFTVQSGDCILFFPQGESKPAKFEIPSEKIFGEITDFQFSDDIFKNGEDVVFIG